jgi:hypothetical protein
MSEPIRAHPNNVPGPFYVVDGCCTACGVPFAEAPGLFAYDGAYHCYVKRQPGTKDELNGMLRAAWASEVQCIRYRGKDPEVLRRLAELGEAHLCDVAPPPGVKPVLRNHVTFDAAHVAVESMTARDLALAFQEYLRSLNQDWLSYRFTPIVESGTTAAFSYSWFKDNFHPLEFRCVNLPDCRWLVAHSPAEKAGGRGVISWLRSLIRSRVDSFVEKAGSRGVSNGLHGWLKSDARFCKIRWYTEKQWKSSKEWQETPW